MNFKEVWNKKVQAEQSLIITIIFIINRWNENISLLRQPIMGSLLC